MRFLRVGDVVLHHALRPGQAGLAPVVFLNSLGTDGRIWDGVIERLPEGWPTLTMDHRGHGLSDHGPVSIDALAADMAGLMDAVGLRGALVCGVSVGGMAAQALCAARPDLARAALLLCTGHRIGDAASWDARIAAVREGGMATIADAVLERWLSPGFGEEHPALLAGCRTMLLRTPVEGYAATCAAIRDADLTETAARPATSPSLCLAGEADRRHARPRSCAELVGFDPRRGAALPARRRPPALRRGSRGPGRADVRPPPAAAMSPVFEHPWLGGLFGDAEAAAI